MSKSTAREALVSGRNPTGHHHRVVGSPTWEWVVAKPELACLSREAQVRRSWLTWHVTKGGGNVSLTCRHFGISRPTFYRWQKQLSRQGLTGLENKSHKPHCVRRRTWTAEQIEAVLRVRNQYPAWGKEKIRVVLAREDIRLSSSMIGRILTHLRVRNLLREPVRRPRRSWKRAHPRPWARRKPREFVALFPGDLVQVDTKDVRPIPGKVFKQLTLVDVVSRYGAAEIGVGAKALTMADYLDRMLERLPFQVAGIQIDGGSEFKADFETYCEKKRLHLFVLPPYSPKLNGAVERMQRTYEEEHHQCSDAEPRVEALRQALLEYEMVYNTIRPHQALGYRTPQEYLDLGKAAA
jgi:putative transposase